MLSEVGFGSGVDGSALGSCLAALIHVLELKGGVGVQMQPVLSISPTAPHLMYRFFGSPFLSYPSYPCIL